MCAGKTVDVSLYFPIATQDMQKEQLKEEERAVLENMRASKFPYHQQWQHTTVLWAGLTNPTN